jgi:triacylglycerol esterase/lipase EstA (alpha/beta hydrolase family)/tetratricopeptide (TPR) repeat protein
MSITFSIPGLPDRTAFSVTRGGPLGADSTPTTDLLDDVEVRYAFSLSPAARAQGAVPETVVAEDDDIIEIDADGFTLWTSARQYEETVRTFRPEATRAGVVVVDALPGPGAAERGFGEWRASAVRLLRLGRTRLEEELKDATVLADFAKDFGFSLVEKAGSWATAKALIWLIERRLRPREGLYTWTQATRVHGKDEPEPGTATFDSFDTSQPILLFLHGTGSSTRGSFGEFLGPAASDQWTDLTRHFKDNIYAFEHKTLSRSPIENAIMVATALPAGAKLYLVSHSRGGMIGDLLCLPNIPVNDIAAFTRYGEYDDADGYDRRCLQKLSAILAEKQFRVQRFARAACPARGTLLASENLDQFLSVLTYLVGLIPGLGQSPLYEIVKRITLETAHRRWEPQMLSGLEAMTPTSPLVALLNAAKGGASGSLGVIAGDIQGGNWLKRFGVLVSDRFIYENRDNDLVVNTNSMFEGAARTTARYVYDRGSDVSHFNYFKNKRTRARVAQWIIAPNELALSDFRPLAEAKVEPVPLDRSNERGGTDRPVVFVVPDLMGSDLHADGTRIWLNYEALARGDFDQLADVHDAKVAARSVLGEHYKPLFDHLAFTHYPVPFPYDWRQSIARTANDLRTRIDAKLKETAQPVRIVAHGAGGLIVRLLVRDHPETWKAFVERPQSRVVLLGAPHRGTYESVEMLLGTHPIVQQLALLDRKRGTRGIVEIIQNFPGVVELLPRGGTIDFFNADTWQAFSATRGGAQAPSLDVLNPARAVLDGLTTPEPYRNCNVAGSAPRTVCGVELHPRRVALAITSEGDGRVTHDSVELRDGITWYMDVGHGGLTADPTGFPAIVHLLQQGDTTLLPTSRPNASRGGETRQLTAVETVLYPTDRDLLLGTFGYAAPSPIRGAEPAGFRVSVVHGDLFFAKFPIVVGHYEGDTIVGAEAVVDRLLGGALTTRYHLGLYPGPIDTISVVLREPTPLQRALQLPNGAIVVGLGRWGELTSGQIANLVRRCALHYVLQLDDSSVVTGGSTGAPTVSVGVGLSILLIGATSASNISIDDSVAAILRGIAQANKELDERVEATTRRIAEIEIVELFSDAAIEAARSVNRLARSLSEELKIKIEAAPLLQRGRQGRVRLAASRFYDAWRRWEITAHESDGVQKRDFPEPVRKWLDESIKKDTVASEVLKSLAGMTLQPRIARPQGRLKFVSLSERARAEVMLEQHQPGLIDRLIRSSIGNTQFQSESARALFELMVPNDLKDGLGQLSRVVFVVDGETSRYPWELMTDAADRPLCTRIGMVRQLQSAEYRSWIRVTTGKTAYIVGDPLVTPPFNRLPGARREAELVTALLTKNDFTTTVPADPPTALTVLGGLLAQPYRIVHLAGHGHYEGPDAVDGFGGSGMVLDNGTLLTAAELRKMTQVPELVFLNCCFIGQTGPSRPAASRDVEYNRLAASVSRELIEMGVRAVVASGWAVRDDAALVFAQAFYDAMLGGATFGRALQTARERTWTQYPDVNTWGAYQAYGDPDFRLITLRGGTTAPSEQVAPEELLEEITHIGRDAQNYAREKDVTDNPQHIERRESELLIRLKAIAKDSRAEWLKRSDVRMALAEAYGDLGQYQEANDNFLLALDTGELDSKTTIRAVEQLFNFEARLGKANKDTARIATAIDRLKALQSVAATSERHSLIGAAYKRLADLTSDTAAQREMLNAAADAYASAHKHNEERDAFYHYPVVNWLALKAVLGGPPDNALALLDKSEANARDRFTRSRDTADAVFDAVAPADIAVVRALVTNAFATANDDRNKEIDRVVAMYREAFQRVQATTRQKASAAGQLMMLANLMRTLRPDDNLTAEALTTVYSKASG